MNGNKMAWTFFYVGDWPILCNRTKTVIICFGRVPPKTSLSTLRSLRIFGQDPICIYSISYFLFFILLVCIYLLFLFMCIWNFVSSSKNSCCRSWGVFFHSPSRRVVTDRSSALVVDCGPRKVDTSQWCAEKRVADVLFNMGGSKKEHV